MVVLYVDFVTEQPLFHRSGDILPVPTKDALILLPAEVERPMRAPWRRVMLVEWRWVNLKRENMKRTINPAEPDDWREEIWVYLGTPTGGELAIAAAEEAARG